MSVVVQAKKVSALPTANTIANSDLLIVEKVISVSNTGVVNSVTSSITGHNFKVAMCMGPYLNDATANTNGVQIGEMYYDPTGVVHVRLS